ncbi:MAG TPA: CopG family transcriptional regulator [Candidatus Saccharibacteria bacterium]|nr:CopG family transcriptional regulator [Candidatus Saccharibacteria bacterium]
MSSNDTKTTLYLSPNVRRALKKRVIDTNQTMSEYVNRAVAFAIAEDLEDIEAIEERRNEPTESLDNFLESLKKDGLI